MRKKIFKVCFILLFILSILLCYNNMRLEKNIKELKEQVQIQHNNYTECISRSIEDKWLVEQFREMITEEEVNN